MSTTVLRSHKNNPAPGEDGHDHWGGKRPAGIPRALWQAYGDRYPGSYCRDLQNRKDGLDPATFWAESARRRTVREQVSA